MCGASYAIKLIFGRLGKHAQKVPADEAAVAN